MRKFSLIGIAMLIVSIPTFAGGILTNTNQHVSFLRMLARGASIDIDGVYSNPAGLAFLPEDGLYLSLNGQSAYQTRNIKATFPLFIEDGNTRYYKGKASAPFIPSFQGAYKKGDWTISGSFAVVGGGGKASFDDGLGMFDSMVMGQVHTISGGQITPNMYSINSAMDGSQFIYGVQLGLSYQVNDWLGVFAGGRMNYFTGGYEGFLTATAHSNIPTYGGMELVGIDLDCDQTGWGIAPIIGVDFKAGRLNLAAKYEFKTRMRLKNKSANSLSAENISMLDKYADGKKVAEDSPALLTVGAQYELLPSLRIMAGYHHYFDVDTKQYTKDMLGDTNEYLFGAEFDINKYVQISAGAQRTSYAFNDEAMNDISYNVSSWSYGLGVGVNVTEKVKINAAWFHTLYDDYNKLQASGTMNISNSFTRSNRVIGLGVDIKL